MVDVNAGKSEAR